MSVPNSIFAICGEFSGESHLARVVLQLKLLYPSVEVVGMGSELTAAAGMKNLIDYKDYSFAGVTQVIANLVKILKLKKLVVQKILELKPDFVLMTDYAGFNMQIAKAIRAAQRKDSVFKKIKLVQYIAPQIWASRPHRIKNIKKNIDHVFYTLPFEKEIYEKAQQNASYVGNPVLESLISESDLECKKEIIETLNTVETKIIGIFPGSRGFEVTYILPLFIETATRLYLRYPDLNFIIARAPTISLEQLMKCGLNEEARKFIHVIDSESISNANQKLLKAADYLWLCSGTVTLEAALYEKPYFLTYKANSINFALYKILRIIEMAGLANIIAGKFIVKEFLQENATVENFLNETIKCLEDSNYRLELINGFKLVKEKLGNYKSSELVVQKLCSI